jgi:hypothetical protein
MTRQKHWNSLYGTKRIEGSTASRADSIARNGVFTDAVTLTVEDMSSLDPRWAAVVARDRRADGAFLYSVETTGVYCRPSCGSRVPNPKNVRFHRTAADAARAGFRPCRRCRPDRAPREQPLNG